MFGYVMPLKDELKIKEYNEFKSYYCGLCFYIKRSFGNFPRLFLNYDMTFLGLLLDSLSSDKTKFDHRKCITNPVNKKSIVVNCDALTYAAAMNVSLVYYKLLDDASDDKNIKSRLVASYLKLYTKKFDPKICEINEVIQKNLNNLSLMEKEKSFTSIDEICHPFSLIVAQMLKMYPYAIPNDNSSIREDLFQFGYALGKWIYLIDALDDLNSDMKQNKFNPLNYLYNQKQLEYEQLLKEIKDTVSFTILNCGYNCMLYLDKLPITKNKDILKNIITLGMMDQYNKVVHTCHHKHKKRK